MRAKQIFSAKKPVGVVYRSNTPNGYQFVRSLGEAGVPVLALNDGSALGHLGSRYALSMTCPDALKDSEAFVQFLVQVGRRLPRKATLYLMNDPHLIVAAHNRHVLDKYYSIPLPEWEGLEKCMNKAIMHRVAQSANIPTPVTFAPENDDELAGIAREVPYPCILKPISRFEYRDGALRQRSFQQVYGTKALRAHNSNELHRFWQQTQTDDFQVIVQEEIQGSEDRLYSVGLYADRESQVKAVFTGRKLHQLPPDFGMGVYCESVTEPAIVALAETFVGQLGFHGIAHIEFKLDTRDGCYKLMEINPRGWQWNYLAKATGVNLPYVALCDLQGLPLPPSSQTTSYRTWIYIGDEIKRYWHYCRKGIRCEKTSWPAWLAWTARTLLREDNDDAVLSWRDPVPAVFMLARALGLGLRRMLRPARPVREGKPS